MKAPYISAILSVLLVIGIDAKLQEVLRSPQTSGRNVYNICEDCVPRELIYAPGFGFDFTSSYATGVVRYHNKTVVEVVRLDGDELYIDLMERMSRAPTNGPPFGSVIDRLRWEWKQAQRKIRRLRGLPETNDIENLSKFIYYLAHLTASKIGEKYPERAVGSFPNLPSLEPYDIDEAFAFANIQSLQSYKHQDPLREVNAVYAGMGFGLCTHWEDLIKCEDEEEKLEAKSIMSISFTSKELIIEKGFAWNAHHISVDADLTDTFYGYDSCIKMDCWESMLQVISTFAQGEPVEEILLRGEYADNEKFLDVVRKALGSRGTSETSLNMQALPFNMTFITARGAAEFAKRWQGETWDCVEDEWC